MPSLPVTPANDPDKVATPCPAAGMEFTFENFIRGSSNQFAYAAAQAVAANPRGPTTPCSSTATRAWAKPTC